MEKKRCKECGESFSGRSDKKFCSDACRNSYNNHINKDVINFIRNTNNRLRKNWRILEEINPSNKIKTTKKHLQNKGFDFSLFTSIYKTKDNSVYYFCYNQGYLELENDMILVVKNNNTE
ncbi:MAG: hypothetical protein IT232_01180 [Flavobacteriales bacterium]|nr:hypothetical protein [Flavobacteriales bacterium]